MRVFAKVLAFLPAAILIASCSSDEAADPAKKPECEGTTIECSEDALTVRTCQDGTWQVTECMREQGKLCDAGACVEPWRWGSPKFDQCASEPRATPESLKEKAEYFEEISKRLHVHPKLGWMSDVELPCAGSDCTKPGVPEATATYDDVATWDTGENDGLWSALYMGAEAYRWAVTKDPAALEMLKLLLASEETRMEITGTRDLHAAVHPSGVPGIACPTDPKQYAPDEKKVSNHWVRVTDDGCLENTDPTTLAWKKSSVCGLGKYAGWCFLDNVSEDEYAGHMFALGAVAKLVDDPDVQATVKGLLAKVGDHLIENELTFRDWDGKVTEHGKIFAGTFFGGYNAAMSLSFMKTIALATGIQKYDAFYQDCLLQRSGEKTCIHHLAATTKPYDDVLSPVGLNLGCKANWNNYSMYMLSLHGLLWGEHDPVVRQKAQAVLEGEMWNPPDDYPRPLSEQNNSFFDFIYAAGKPIGPNDPPATKAVENGICMLRQFPAHKVPVDVTCPASSCVEVCKDRFGNPMTDYPRPIAERCLGRFVWWGSPYSTGPCTAAPRHVNSPADYLVAYWMGRYYGFIDPGS